MECNMHANLSILALSWALHAAWCTISFNQSVYIGEGIGYQRSAMNRWAIAIRS